MDRWFLLSVCLMALWCGLSLLHNFFFFYLKSKINFKVAADPEGCKLAFYISFCYSVNVKVNLGFGTSHTCTMGPNYPSPTRFKQNRERQQKPDTDLSVRPRPPHCDMLAPNYPCTTANVCVHVGLWVLVCLLQCKWCPCVSFLTYFLQSCQIPQTIDLWPLTLWYFTRHCGNGAKTTRVAGWCPVC